MPALKTALAALIALVLPAAPLACDDGADARDPGPSSAELSLGDGAQLLFLADAGGEVTILEASARPGGESLLGGLEERGVTPAELWVAVADGEEVPAFLRDHHEATVERALERRGDVRLPSLRGWEHAPAWGGGDGYCRDSFPADFEVYNPVTTAVSVAGYTGPVEPRAIYGYSNVYVRHAWVAVCNDTPPSATSSSSQIGISRWDAASGAWRPMLCGPGAPSPNWCLEISAQEAKALHYWTSASAGQKLRFEARWGGGEDHPSKLRAGYAALGFSAAIAAQGPSVDIIDDAAGGPRFMTR